MAEALDSCYIHARSYYSTRKVVQLDTSNSDVKNAVKTAKKILSGKKVPSLNVNWLSELENDASLARYLGC
jgi:broad-specificity NMP kinase